MTNPEQKNREASVRRKKKFVKKWSKKIFPMPKNAHRQKFRGWVYTFFGEQRVLDAVDCQYMVYQQERCPETLRLHWQGYVYFENPRAFGGVQTLLPGAHIEPRRGTHSEAVDYCTKLETRVADPVFRGTAPAQGERKDLDAFADKIRAGASDRDLAAEYGSLVLRYPRGIDRLRLASNPDRRHKTRVIVLWGPTGCGKSRWAHDMFPEAYIKTPGNEWWDGYRGQAVIILDEFYGQIKHEYMLKLMDRYRLELEVKGGYTRISAQLLVITSNADPVTWYAGLGERGISWEPQFFRRIEDIYQFAGGRWHRAAQRDGSNIWYQPVDGLPDGRSLLEPVRSPSPPVQSVPPGAPLLLAADVPSDRPWEEISDDERPDLAGLGGFSNLDDNSRDFIELD